MNNFTIIPMFVLLTYAFVGVVVYAVELQRFASQVGFESALMSVFIYAVASSVLLVHFIRLIRAKAVTL